MTNEQKITNNGDIDTLQCRVYNTEYKDNLTRTFIEVPIFSRRWREIGLGEDEQQNLTKDEKNVLKKMVKALKSETARNRGRKS